MSPAVHPARPLLFRWALLLTALLAVTGCATGATGSVNGGPATQTSVQAPALDRAPVLARTRAWSGTRSSARVVESKRPNIVMVMADDMRVDDLDFAPNVRGLIASNGVTFENSFSPFPLCCPARASFLTGMYAHNHKVYWHEKPYGYQAFDDSSTLATSLSAAGYHTAFIGKYLNGYGRMRSKVSGIQSYRYEPNGWTDWTASFEDPDGAGGIHGSTYNYRDTPYNVNGRVDNTHRGDYQTNTIGEFSLKYAEKYAASSKPFFMYVSYVAPHAGGPRERDDPRSVRRSDGTTHDDDFVTPARPDRVRGRFNDRITRPSGMPKGGGDSDPNVDDKRLFRRFPALNAAERRALTNVTRQRAEAVYVLDRQVGRLVTKLKKTGEWDNTVLMFTSDNGYFLGEHRQRSGKVKPHEPSLRVPFVMTGPGMRDGSSRYDPITTVDLTASIVDLANARPPHPADGSSRVRTMRDGDQGWTVPVLTEAIETMGLRKHVDGFPHGDPRTTIGLRTARWSFMSHRDGAGELYDLAEDPAQMTNLFRDRSYRQVRRSLTDAWWSYKDCAGVTCRAPSTDVQFHATPVEERDLGRRYWKVIDSLYGR